MSQHAAMGRPSRYNAQIAAAVCWELAEGKSLRTIAKAEGMPDASTVHDWVLKRPEFAQQYARARHIQAHALADEGMEIVDGARGGTHEEIAAARLRFDARRWMAGKLLPKVYGDKMLHTGADGEGPIAVKLALDYSLLSPAEMAQMLALIEKATPKRIEAANSAPEIDGEAEESEE